MKNQHKHYPETQIAECPTCRRRAEFYYLGEQTIDPSVAAETGMPDSMGIWQCSRCGTGLLEPNLEFEDSSYPALAVAGVGD